ncbi:helix-turn-helix domain-containing protein [Vibrio breoganii]|uniref:helix-turn-helix domain-containing protein n=1 Tax=Vibrio breoganii TaxID=553239 RepID=UPI000C82BAA8|nr:AraC family transcriptional regulator [Vibrio breoganii]PMF98135.1 hypothetical protein BCV08_09765 [Vibrio breoganii]PMG95056.1 hypothetical protein BCU79_10740 [Vibrio breoganii]PMH18427.1 hypothetical protein BCU74_08795 [Vibrio breoganii]PMJ45039.1 hypothetical protein BCU21_14930 [Vibrio breoganii]PMK56245.1 hypothetical protein BCT97_11950 [Vibrio breoganii]
MRKDSRSLLLTASDSMLFFIPYLERHKIDWKSIAKSVDLPTKYSNNEKWIPVKNYSLFIEAITPLCAPDMPIIVGKEAAKSLLQDRRRFFRPNDTFQQALTALITHSHTLTRQNTYWLQKLNEQWCLCNRGNLAPSYPGYAAVEWFRVSLLINLCRHWLGNEWSPSKVNMMTALHQGYLYEGYLFTDTAIAYNQPHLTIELPPLQSFEALASRSLHARDIQEIRLLTETYCHLPSFTIDWLASLFGVTRKTLYRYLKDNHTTFKEIKKQAILSKAEQLLAESNESISDIAFRMGYSDVSNFNRAIKRLSNKTPAQIRKER